MVHEEMRDQTTADPNRQRYVELSTSKYSGITHTSGIARRGTVRCGVMCGSPVNCICSRCPGHHEARPVPEVVVHECGTPLFLWLHFADPNAGVKYLPIRTKPYIWEYSPQNQAWYVYTI